MSRLFTIAIGVLLLSTAVYPQQGPAVAQPDGVTRLVSSFEAALTSGSLDAFHALTAPTFPSSDATAFTAWTHGKIDLVTARVRDREPIDGGVRLLVEALLESDGQGAVSTWQLEARPRADAAGEYEMTHLEQLNAVNSLLKLALDRSQEFRVRDLVFNAPDFALTMGEGVAFLATTADGITGVVLRGSARVHFHPADAGEQGQLIVFAKAPEIAAPIDAAFIRINPVDFETRFSDHSLTPMGVNKQDADRAAEIFDTLAPRSYHIGLGDLSAARWSIVPPTGNAVVEMDTRKYGWLTYARTVSDPEDISFFDRLHHHTIANYASDEKLKTRGRFYSDDDGRQYDILDHDLDVHFAPDRQWVSGRATMRLKITGEEARNVTLHLADSLAVSSVTSPQFGRLLHLRAVGQNLLIISFPTPVERDALITLSIAYAGRLEPPAFTREAIDVTADGPGLQRPADTPVFAPEPEFIYSTGSFWYPQALTTDFATATLRISVPPEFNAVATGSAVVPETKPVFARDGGKTSVNERTTVFRVTRPVRYLSCFIGRLSPVGRQEVAVPALAPADAALPSSGPAFVSLVTVANPRQTGRARGIAASAADIIKFYASLLGEAPYPQLTLAAVDADLPGGHSPAYLAVINQALPTTPYAWNDDPVAFDDYPHFYLAHEVAHQWWGQAVGWKSYHDEWLSEGLAHYFGVLYTASERGPDARRDLLARMRISATTFAAAGPIYLGYRIGHITNDNRAFRSVLYNKSAVVLDMLRRFVGDEAFMNGLRRFYRTSRFQKAGTDDLRQAIEAESHQSLSRFFDRWIIGASMPELRVHTQIAASAGFVDLHVEQLGDVFDVPITLRIEHADGATEEINVPITKQTEDVQVPVKGPVRRVTVDQDLTLAHFHD